MKTIEERAKEYASKKADISLSAVYNEALARIYKEGYIAGATEQKDIDIDTACEIVRNIANECFGDWEQSCKVEDTFRKAMEE